MWIKVSDPFDLQEVYLKTAFLRATFPKMKTPDSIQADVFITNDTGIQTPNEIESLLLKNFL